MGSETTSDTTALQAKAASGANWFYWIAALSVVNSIASATGSTWGFLAGLGTTQMIDGLGATLGSAAKPVVLLLDGLVASLFVALGWWASRKTWVYGTGAVLFALDSLLFLLAKDWLGLAFHGLVLFFLWGGFAARRALDALPAPAASPATEALDQAA